jgi:hypothetical protein
LRAGIALSILDKEKTVSFDLTKEAAPIDGSRGKITVTQIPAANGITMLRISSAAADNPPVAAAVAAVARPLYVTIRVFDKDGKVVANTLASLSNVPQIGMSVQAAAGPPTKVEIAWPEKTRDVVLPVELKDIDVPAPVPVVQPIVRPLPAVVPVPPIKPLVLPN